jgi:hypothetical protein
MTMAETASKKSKGVFSEPATLEQAKDTGMAMVLICLLIAALARGRGFLEISILLLLIDMVWPRLYRPAARLWFGLSRLLGSFMSRILFGLIFLVMVVPVGLVRRALGKDTLQIRKWKKGRTSVLRTRDHGFVSGDIAHPY